VKPPVDAPDVEADAPGRIKAEMIECRDQLHAAARDPWMLGRGAEQCIGRDRVGGLAQHHAIGGDATGRDRGLCPLRGSRTGRARPAAGRRACALSCG
jgi:hypothetical protein